MDEHEDMTYERQESAVDAIGNADFLDESADYASLCDDQGERE
jgi:hypothetical protein